MQALLDFLGVTEIAGAVRQLPRAGRLALIALAAVAAVAFVERLAEIPWMSALRGSDNSFNYFWLRSAMVDGDWSFENDVNECNTLTPEARIEVLAAPRTETGRVANKYGTGWALAGVPAYLFADSIVALGRFAGLWGLANDGYNPVYQIILQCWHALIAIAGLLIAYRCARRWFDPRAALAGVVGVWAAGPMLYYQTTNLSMSHGVAFTAVAAAFLGFIMAERHPGRLWPWLLAGAATGLAVITRYQLAVSGVLVLAALLMHVRLRGWGGCIRAALACAAGAVPFLLLQMWAWRVVYGRWLLFSYGEEGEGFNWLEPALSSVLFSSYHGLFYWHPFLLWGVTGMAVWGCTSGWLARAGLLMVLLIAYLNAAWWCWWFGSSFGSRAFDACLLFMMCGLAWWFARLGPRGRALLGWCMAAGAVWNAWLLLIYCAALIPRNEPVGIGGMLSAALHLGELLP